MNKLQKGFIKISIASLVEANWNYKKENKKLMTKLENNIKRNGLIENLLIRELDSGFYEVVNGNHRLQALKNIKWTKDVMVFNLGDITLKQAQRIAIETNETKFEKDEKILSTILVDLIEEWDLEEMEITIPFTESEITVYVESVNLDLGNEPPPTVSFTPNKNKVSIDFETENNKKRFLRYMKKLEGKTSSEKLLKALSKYLKK